MTIVSFGHVTLPLNRPCLLEPAQEVRPECQSYFLRANGRRVRASGAGQGALHALASGLGPGESIWIEARRGADAARSMALTAGASFCADENLPATVPLAGRFDELAQVLSLEFPEVEVVAKAGKAFETGAPTLPDNHFPVRLRGLPLNLSDLNGAADPDLLAVSPKEPVAPKHVVLGACATDHPLSEALALLREVPSVEGLRLTLTRRQLLAPELRKLSELYGELEALRQSSVLTAQEVARMGDISALVAAWLAAKSGVEFSLSLFASEPPGPALGSAFGALFSLPPSARRDTVQPLLDLSGCFVPGQSLPALTLGADIARHLARAPDEPALADPGRAFLGVAGTAPVLLDSRARSRHLLACGATGTGKSTLLKNLIAADIRAGVPVVLIDPHGDLFEDVLALLNRHPDLPVWVADTGDLNTPYSLNLLQTGGDIYRQNFTCNQLIRLLKNSLYKNVPEGFGPMFEAYFRNAYLLLADGGRGAFTIGDLHRVFGEAKLRRELLENCRNDQVNGFWRNIATKAGGEASLENIAPYIVSKLTQFVGNPVINPIVCARQSTIDFNEILETGGSCIVSLAKGKVGATEAELLGGIFTTALFSAALARGGRPFSERRPVRVYLDEFQSYAGETISEMLAECRKYGLELTLATQSLNRLKHMNGDLTQSVLGNTANIVALRSGPDDAGLLSYWIGGDVTREEIMSLDDFQAVGRFLEQGRVTLPISFRLESELG